MKVVDFLAHPFVVMACMAVVSMLVGALGFRQNRKNLRASMEDLDAKVGKKFCYQNISGVRFQLKNMVEAKVCAQVQSNFRDSIKATNARVNGLDGRVREAETDLKKVIRGVAFLVGKHSDGDPKGMGLEV